MLILKKTEEETLKKNQTHENLTPDLPHWMPWCLDALMPHELSHIGIFFMSYCGLMDQAIYSLSGQKSTARIPVTHFNTHEYRVGTARASPTLASRTQVTSTARTWCRSRYPWYLSVFIEPSYNRVHGSFMHVKKKRGEPSRSGPMHLALIFRTFWYTTYRKMTKRKLEIFLKALNLCNVCKRYSSGLVWLDSVWLFINVILMSSFKKWNFCICLNTFLAAKMY